MNMQSLNFRTLLLALVCPLAPLGIGTCEQVPKTLDLACSAEHAINALTGTTDERGEFMFRCSIAPPSLAHDAYSFSACGPKYIESLAMTSLMTGTNLDESKARVAVNYLVSCLGEDGLLLLQNWSRTSLGHVQPRRLGKHVRPGAHAAGDACHAAA